VIDLFSLILSGAASWGIGKVLDVTFDCFTCGEQNSTDIGNQQRNELECTNCYKQVTQFTNLCPFTLCDDRAIGHVGASFDGTWTVDVDPSTGLHHPGWLFFANQIRALDLNGKQLAFSGELRDFQTAEIYSQRNWILSPSQRDFFLVGPPARIALRWDMVPAEFRNERILAVDLVVASRFNDELCRERLLVQPWVT
jgi:hypothetical protein